MATAPRTSGFSTPTNNGSRGTLIALLLLFAAAIGLRLINLDADPVAWFIGEIGYQIDEGYKTLGPRNLSLFGDTNWHPLDEYPGWMSASAATQWPYYWSFKTFGTTFSSARLVSIFYHVAMVAVVAAFLWRRLSPGLAVLGAALLLTDPGLFLFSRSALFETALTFFAYVPLVVALAVPQLFFALSPILLLGLVTAPAFYYLKKSVIIYTAPSALVLAANVMLQDRLRFLRDWRVVTAAIALGVAAVAGFLYVESWILDEIDYGGLLAAPHRIFLNPVHVLSPIALILGYGVLLELLLTRPDTVLKNLWRLCLGSLVLIGPIMLSFFIYNYPRYYIPLIPAALLLAVERLSLTEVTPKLTQRRWFALPNVLAFIVFLALSMTVLATLNHYVIANLPINIGDDRGISDPGLLKLYLLFTPLFGLFLFIIARWWKTIGRPSIATATLLAIAIGIGIALTAVFKPSYQSHQVQQALLSHTGTERTVGGDWAPFFAMNSELKVLYMRPDWNTAQQVGKLRVDFFLSSGTPYDNKNLKNLRVNPEVVVGEPIPLGTFYRHDITLYPLSYPATDLPESAAE